MNGFSQEPPSDSRNIQERKLRYRDLLNKVEAINESDDLGLQTIQDINNIIKEVNDLQTQGDINERIEHTDETLLDSTVLSSTSKLLLKCTESVDVFSYTYDPADFANRINQFIAGDGDNNLMQLLDEAQSIIPEMPLYRFVYGAHDLSKLPQPKPEKVRQKPVKEKLDKKQPEKVTALGQEGEGIDQIVKEMYDVLLQEYEQNNEEAINYYDYVVDTDSFSNTVENMFYCSFLIRNGKAHITLNRRASPYIKPMKKRELKDFKDGGGSNAQMISTISYNDWEKFKKQGFLQKFKKTQTK